jgi:hypothetical protein
MNARPPRATWWHRIKWKILWAGWALVVPEWVLMVALTQMQFARSLRDQRNTIVRTANANESTNVPRRTDNQTEKGDGNGDEDEVNVDDSPVHVNCPASEMTRAQKDWTLTHSYFALMGGFQLKMTRTSLGYDLAEKEANIINPWGLLRLMELKMFPNDIPKQLIYARSKSDSLGKGLICFQIMWMMIQIIARKVTGLPVTLLELNTAAHIGCTILLYSIWWYKPQDVRVLVVVDISGCEKCKSTLIAEDFKSKGLVREIPNVLDEESLEVVIRRFGLTKRTSAFLMIALSAVYGGIHAAAWDSHFPSLQERIIWRVAACSVIGGSVFMWGPMAFEESEVSWLGVVSLIAIIPFAFGRLYLLVEAFISVRSLPVGAYETANWVNFLPHIG